MLSVEGGGGGGEVRTLDAHQYERVLLAKYHASWCPFIVTDSPHRHLDQTRRSRDEVLLHRSRKLVNRMPVELLALSDVHNRAGGDSLRNAKKKRGAEGAGGRRGTAEITKKTTTNGVHV